jgi:putative oxidoreductase
MHVSSSTQKLLNIARGGLQRASFVGPLLARLTIGVAFIESGWGKVNNLDKVTAFFTELGIPAPAFQATFVSWVELVCGTLVLIGLATRLAAVPLICTMIVALITAKAEDIGGVGDLVGLIEFTYIALLAWLVVAGPGLLSLDHLIARRAVSGAPDAVSHSSSKSGANAERSGVHGARA